jgi:hypothetical protein
MIFFYCAVKFLALSYLGIISSVLFSVLIAAMISALVGWLLDKIFWPNPYYNVPHWVNFILTALYNLFIFQVIFNNCTLGTTVDHFMFSFLALIPIMVNMYSPELTITLNYNASKNNDSITVPYSNRKLRLLIGFVLFISFIVSNYMNKSTNYIFDFFTFLEKNGTFSYWTILYTILSIISVITAFKICLPKRSLSDLESDLMNKEMQEIWDKQK